MASDVKTFLAHVGLAVSLYLESGKGRRKHERSEKEPRLEQELLALLRQRVEQDQQMLTAMRSQTG